MTSQNFLTIKSDLSRDSDHLLDEFGISRAEIARQLGVCTSAIAKAIQNTEGEEQVLIFDYMPRSDKGKILFLIRWRQLVCPQNRTFL